ncbi:MAG TPA: cell envelope integrity protein TolA [Chitinivibrionales bacterium]|nr:cell envelope integrity protein TolA [Chitinivibrionales bacterium]
MITINQQKITLTTFKEANIKTIFIIAGACAAILMQGFSGGSASGEAAASSGADDLISMARSGVDEEVLQTYIESSQKTYDLSADDIITLKDLGVSSKVIRAALVHGRQVDTAEAREEIKEAANDTAAAPPVLSASAVVPPSDSPTMSFFYESLAPYGNWVNIDGQWCWQPNAEVVNPEWAPYFNRGHWVYSDWGWCWVSDYSWGWAPFHYGRWLHHRTHGWCWVPGTEWGPAWVSWRMGDQYCGWAPLPPNTRYVENEGWYFGASRAGVDFEFNLTPDEYHFVPTGHFCDAHPWGHTVPSVRADEAYRRTSFVKNGYSYDRGHFVNRGLPVEVVSKAANRKITAVPIVSRNLSPGQPIQHAQMRNNGLVVYKPAISPAARENPEAVNARLQRTSARATPPAQDFAKRQQDAIAQTVQRQSAAAQNAIKEKADLEKAAQAEADAKKRAALQAEADVRTMRAQQAQAHVAQIKAWTPPKAPPAMPQSKVVQQPAPEKQEQVRTLVQAQVQQEAREEQQRQKTMEEMVRAPRVEQPRAAPPPKVEQKNNNVQNNNAPRGREPEKR